MNILKRKEEKNKRREKAEIDSFSIFSILIDSKTGYDRWAK